MLTDVDARLLLFIELGSYSVASGTLLELDSVTGVCLFVVILVDVAVGGGGGGCGAATAIGGGAATGVGCAGMGSGAAGRVASDGATLLDGGEGALERAGT